MKISACTHSHLDSSLNIEHCKAGKTEAEAGRERGLHHAGQGHYADRRGDRGYEETEEI